MAFLALILLLFQVAATAAEKYDPCAETQAASDVRFTIALNSHGPVFQQGEIVPLELSFTSSTKKRYWASVRNYDRSGRLGIEYYCIEPGAPDPLESYFKFGMFMGGGLGSTHELDTEPFTAEAELNEWWTLPVGHYRLFAISYRVGRPPGAQEPESSRTGQVLRSNTIEIDVSAPDPAWQAQQLHAAVLDLTGTDSKQDQMRRAARRLRFLNTEDSTRQLAKLFTSFSQQQQAGSELMFGLYGSAYRQLAIDSMRAELVAPDHAITDDYLNTLANLQITADHSWDLPSDLNDRPEQARAFWERRQAHMHDLMKAEIQTATAALPRKTGHARAITLNGLLMAGGDPGVAEQIRPQLITAWSDLPRETQHDLIQYRWALIRGPEMLPILRRLAAEPAPAPRTMDAMARDEILKHLYELDAAAGREAILRDLQNPNAQPGLGVVKLLQKDDIAPVVKTAIERIGKGNARELDYQLLDLYADESALNTVQAAYQKLQGQWPCVQQSATLRYLLRVDPEHGPAQVKAALAVRKNTGCFKSLLEDLGSALPKVQQNAIDALNDSDPEMALGAIRALEHWGTADAEPALWARLQRFHKEWTGREDQLRQTPDYQSPGSRAIALEQALTFAIAKGISWTCGPDKLAKLDALVLTKPQHTQLENWIKWWKQDWTLINPAWYPEDKPTFSVLQYEGLTEDQLRAKVAQLPPGTRLRWQFWPPGQISPPVAMDKQDAVYERVHAAGAQHGVILEKTNHP
jgi:hypothetical protein